MNSLFVLTLVLFAAAICCYVSAAHEITPEVRKNLPPEHIESIMQELQTRRHCAHLLLLLALFPSMFFLTVVW